MVDQDQRNYEEEQEDESLLIGQVKLADAQRVRFLDYIDENDSFYR